MSKPCVVCTVQDFHRITNIEIAIDEKPAKFLLYKIELPNILIQFPAANKFTNYRCYIL